MRNLSEYSDGLKRLLLSLGSPEKDYQVDNSKLVVVRNVHDALLREGYPVSMPQAEEIWSAYSYNKFASWMVGGETVEDALSAVIDLCDDIENCAQKCKPLFCDALTISFMHHRQTSIL